MCHIFSYESKKQSYVFKIQDRIVNLAQGYKTFSMLNSGEHEISTAHKN